jgi:hypothetical protein
MRNSILWTITLSFLFTSNHAAFSQLGGDPRAPALASGHS